MPEKHALLSASSAYRWLRCPPSARINAALPDSTSAAAAEGTRAHALAEQRLKAFLAGTPFDTDMHDSDVDAEMLAAVKTYADICVEKIVAARKASPDAQVLVEHQLDYSRWVPEGFGTGDMVIISDASLEVVDFKYGKGVRVEAEDNDQMRLYALGMIDEFGLLYGAESVRMTIVQPRMDNIATAETTVAELLQWIDGLKEPIQAAWKGSGKRHAGAHCRFCKVKMHCRALADYEMQGVREELKASELTETEITDIVLRAASIKRWLTALESYALAQALDGKQWPGLKVVAGRSLRKITDEKKAAEILLAAGYAKEDIEKPVELETLTKLEKIVGKKKLAELLQPVIVKPPGKPALVAESDKRPPMPLSDVKEDFDNNLIES